jgi:3-hydroxyisobutyrate dehydrogenase-like beta-hydroxyacid dehydrogenase
MDSGRQGRRHRSEITATSPGDLIMQSTMPVGIIGLGLMGGAMSERLIAAKVPVIGFDIDPARRGWLKTAGGTVAKSIRALAGLSRTIIVAVYSGEQVEALFDEIASGAGAARPVVICTTTCSPDEIIRLSQRAMTADIPFVEAPISGTSAELRDGTATALVAGEIRVIESVNTLLDILCPRRVNVGEIGNASRTKLAINLILQGNRAALAEGIVFAEHLGLDGRAFLQAARESAASSRVMDTKGEKMLARDFRPIAQTLKDAELILEEAHRRGLFLPVMTAQTGLLRAAIALEGPDSDSAAVIAVIEAIRQRPAANTVAGDDG